MKKKLTAADRPQFHRDAAKMMDGLDIQIGEPDAAAVILCSRAVDFDPETNVLWELEANKSAVRPDVHCSTCDSVVALSNHVYARYLVMDKKPRICCTACLPTLRLP